MLKMQCRLLISSLIATLLISLGCNNPIDEGQGSEPDFNAAGAGPNETTNLFIIINASRESGNVSGSGTLTLGEGVFSLEVTDASLPTDFGIEDPIPQTDDLTPGLIFCTPAFAELTVIVSPGDFETTMRLNECEENNAEIFNENGVIINPCTGEVVTDIEQFIGPCLSDPEIGVEFGKDTIVLNEFNGLCGADSPCIVPIDVVIFVPALQ
ncbi:MAG TPA: hypothetical protein VH878_01090 [Thermodesulfobacteriota bacterium]|jgi:hypothetical protein